MQRRQASSSLWVQSLGGSQLERHSVPGATEWPGTRTHARRAAQPASPHASPSHIRARSHSRLRSRARRMTCTVRHHRRWMPPCLRCRVRSPRAARLEGGHLQPQQRGAAAAALPCCCRLPVLLLSHCGARLRRRCCGAHIPESTSAQPPEEFKSRAPRVCVCVCGGAPVRVLVENSFAASRRRSGRVFSCE